MSTTTDIISKSFTAAALTAELGRRRNNKARRANGEPIVRATSYVLPALSKEVIERIQGGETVPVEFKSGRIVHVSLKG